MCLLGNDRFHLKQFLSLQLCDIKTLNLSQTGTNTDFGKEAL